MDSDCLALHLGNLGPRKVTPVDWMEIASVVEFNVGPLPWDAERIARTRQWIADVKSAAPRIQFKGVSLFARDFMHQVKTLEAVEQLIQGAATLVKALPEVDDWVLINELGHSFAPRRVMSLHEFIGGAIATIRPLTTARLWARDLAPTADMQMWDWLPEMAALHNLEGIELQCRVDIGNPPHRGAYSVIKGALKRSRIFPSFKAAQIRPIIERSQALGLRTGLAECTVFVGPNPGRGEFGAQRRMYQSWVDMAIATGSHISWWDWFDPLTKPDWFYRHLDYPGLWTADGTPRHPDIIGQFR